MLVIYKDPRIIKKVSIPGIEGSEVELWNTLLWGEVEKIYSFEGTEIEKSTKVVLSLIKDWNLANEKEVKLPITEETLRSFKPSVIIFLIKQTDFNLDELKKNLT